MRANDPTVLTVAQYLPDGSHYLIRYVRATNGVLLKVYA